MKAPRCASCLLLPAAEPDRHRACSGPCAACCLRYQFCTCFRCWLQYPDTTALVQAGTAHWPYTWADCEMIYAMNLVESGGSYCNGNHEHTVDCNAAGLEMTGNEIDAYIKDMITAFDDNPVRVFRENSRRWEHYVNKGLNRMTAAGATWSSNTVRAPTTALAVVPWRIFAPHR